MTEPTPPKASDAVALDLQDYSQALASLLPVLLFSRDREALTRWSAVRSWIDNAQDGEATRDLATIGLAVAYLAERGADYRGD